MTMAVCFRCGTIKHGAFNPCPNCKAEPDTDEELATSLAMTDHYFPIETLNQMALSIRAGQPPILDPETLNNIANDKQFRMVRRVRRMIRRSFESPNNQPPPEEPPKLLNDSRTADNDIKPLAGPLPETPIRETLPNAESPQIQHKPEQPKGAFAPHSDESETQPDSNGSPTVGIGCLIFMIVALIKLVIVLTKNSGR